MVKKLLATLHLCIKKNLCAINKRWWWQFNSINYYRFNYFLRQTILCYLFMCWWCQWLNFFYIDRDYCDAYIKSIVFFISPTLMLFIKDFKVTLKCECSLIWLWIQPWTHFWTSAAHLFLPLLILQLHSPLIRNVILKLLFQCFLILCK